MPLIALTDGLRTRASKDGPRRGSCIDCGDPMIAKTGSVVAWHWAHRPGSLSCHWEPETEWHLAWKSQIDDLDRIEVRSPNDGLYGRRRADLLTPYEWAVEFQHSHISTEDARAREIDWRNRVIWVVDGRDAYSSSRIRFWVHELRSGLRVIEWAYAPAWVTRTRMRTFLDLGGDGLFFVGRWFPKQPKYAIRGYGWTLTAKEFTESVLNGARPPDPPGFRHPLNPIIWRDEASLGALRVATRSP